MRTPKTNSFLRIVYRLSLWLFTHAALLSVTCGQAYAGRKGQDQDARSWGVLRAQGSVGKKAVLVLPLDFSDVPGDPMNLSEAKAVMSQVNQIYVENSYGLTSLSVTICHTLRLPQTAAFYGQEGGKSMNSNADAVARTAGYDVARYDKIMYVINTMALPGGGNGGGRTVVLNNGWSVPVIAHELGHCYGLPHANGWASDDGSPIGAGFTWEYMNPFDVVGGTGGGGQRGKTNGEMVGASFSIYSKYILGWVPRSAVTNVTANGVYEIQQHDSPLSTGVRGLHLFRDGRDYWVEFRPRAFATNTVRADNSAIANGVCILRAHDPALNEGADLLSAHPAPVGYPGWTLFDNLTDSPFVVGQTFSDTAAGIYITPIAVTTSTPLTIKVNVQVGTKVPAQPPAFTLTASATTAQVNLPITFTATAEGGTGESLSYYWEYGDSAVGTNSPVVSKRWNTGGEYVVRCTVSNMKGGTASKAIMVRIGQSNAARIVGRVQANSTSLAGVVVSAIGGGKVLTGETSSDGTYQITNVPAGTYSLKAVMQDFKFGPQFSSPVSVKPGVENTLNFSAVNTVRTTSVVTNTQAYGPGSLCDAMMYAQAHPGHHITFNIPDTDSNYIDGRYIIRPRSRANPVVPADRTLGWTLPPIDANGTVIDATTQPGYAGSPVIELDLGEVPSGLKLYASNCVVKGLLVDNSKGDAILLTGARSHGNTIISCWVGACLVERLSRSNASSGIRISKGASRNRIGIVGFGNVIAGNTSAGVSISDIGTTGNTVVANRIGTDPSGMVAVPNKNEGIAIWSGASGNVVGGNGDGVSNLISGNGSPGVSINGDGTNGNTVANNGIGLDSSGQSALGNGREGVAIWAGASGNTITNNLVSGNVGMGICMNDASTVGNSVYGNMVGFTLNRTAPLPNRGGGIGGNAARNNVGRNITQ